MRVLHICTDFANRKLYNELIESLEHNGVSEQFVYVPVRSDGEVDRNRNESLANTQYRYIRILGKHHRLLFRRKIATVFSDLDANVDATPTSTSTSTSTSPSMSTSTSTSMSTQTSTTMSTSTST